MFSMRIDERLGAVYSFELPDNWITDEPLEIDARITRIYHAPENPDYLFCHHFRDFPLSRSSSIKLHNILNAPLHVLTQTEIDDLEEVLEGVSNRQVFSILLAQTDILNSRRIIKVRGDWVESQQSVLTCFIEHTAEFEHIQNLFFSVPMGRFEEWAAFADRVFMTVKWTAPNLV